MTDKERARAQQLLAQIESVSLARSDAETEQFGLISEMLLTYPVASASIESGRARGKAYLEAVRDIPPAIIATAIRQWNRGECGEHDYRWAPAPAVLRSVCTNLMEPLKDAADDIRVLLSTISLERAMDPRPLESETRPALRSMLGAA